MVVEGKDEESTYAVLSNQFSILVVNVSRKGAKLAKVLGELCAFA